MNFADKGQPLTRAGLDKVLAILGSVPTTPLTSGQLSKSKVPGSPEVSAFVSIAGRRYSSSVIFFDSIRTAVSTA